GKFPYQLVTVSGDLALAEFDRLRKAGSGSPVIIGDDADMSNIIEAFELAASPRSPQEILVAADKLLHPQSIRDLRASETKRLLDNIAARPDRYDSFLRDPYTGKLLTRAAIDAKLKDGSLARSLANNLEAG